MVMKRLCFILLVSFAASFCFAQQPHYLFQRLGVKDGLFEEIVHSIQQDAKGFIWLNLRNLVQRYDGYRFVNFFPGVDLPDGNVRAMLIDKKNRLWLLNSEATVGYLNPENFTYHSVKVNIPKGYTPVISNMYLNRQNQVMLVWDKQGFITSNTDATEADAKYNPFVLPESWQPIHILQDDASNYWIGTYSGLVKFNTSRQSLSFRGNNADNDPAIRLMENNYPVIGVHADKNKNIWTVTPAGATFKIHSVNQHTGKYIQWENKIAAASGNISYTPFGIIETTENGMWITGDNILCKLNSTDETVQYIPKTSLNDFSIRYDAIYSFYEDREHNIWLGTNKGIFRFNPQAQLFTIIENRRSDNLSVQLPVTGFLEKDNGTLLVSTAGQSLFSYDAKFQPVLSPGFQKSSKDAAVIMCMLKRPNGDIWLGTRGTVLQVMDAASNNIKLLSTGSVELKSIRQMVEDQSGNIWLGSQQGELFRWNAADAAFSKIHQLGGLITRIRVDSKNMLWVGTDRDGLYYINSGSGKIIQHFTSKGKPGEKLLFQGVSDILQYNDSIFYFSGNGLSILNMNTKLFQYFTISNGLPSANISNLLKDKAENIWMTTGSGIVSYHPVKRKLSHYTAEDGVHNLSYIGGAAAMLKNGKIAFGTNQDFMIFDPAVLTARRYLSPKVQISSIEVMGVPVNTDSVLKLSQLSLEHNKNAFKVFLATLNYKDVHPVFYMLEGIDKEWKKAGKTNVIEYNYLPPGKYVLKATCFEENGKHGEITAINIYIAAPFYNTWWFYSLVALTIVGLLYWFDRERTKRKEAVQKTRSNIAGQLHEEINTALNNINILSEMARLKAESEPEKAVQFIEQIHGRSHNMIIAMDDMLWSIAPENDSMSKAVDRMSEYIEALNNRHGIKIEMQADEKLNSLKPDMQLRHEAFLLFKDSIKSLVDAGVSNCQIHLSTEKSQLLYSMQFDTATIDMQQLNSLLQRQDMSKRIDALQAKLTVTPHRNSMMMELKVPV